MSIQHPTFYILLLIASLLSVRIDPLVDHPILSHRLRGGSPPPGFSCRCGATVPGKGPTCKWRKGPNGEYLCNSCGLYSKKEKKEGKRFKEKEKEKEKEVDLNPWICCDRCQKWVRAKSDGIDDISIYDDNNPDHLDYYCPACRAKEEQGKRGMKRGRGGRTGKI
jgi:hypothetical protein